MRIIVIILRLRIDDMTEISALKSFSAVDDTRVIVAGFAKHVNLSRLLNSSGQLGNFLKGYRWWNSRIDVFVTFESLNSLRAMQVMLGEDGDGINIGLAEFIK